MWFQFSNHFSVIAKSFFILSTHHSYSVHFYANLKISHLFFSRLFGVTWPPSKLTLKNPYSVSSRLTVEGSPLVVGVGLEVLKEVGP